MKSAFVIFVESSGWRVARADTGDVQQRPCPQCRDLPGRAQAAAEALKELGYRGQDVCLALGSQYVYSARIRTDNLSRRQRRQAMTFRLEEQLPLDAEQLTVDFIRLQGDAALGLAVETSTIKEILDALSEVDIEIGPLCPSMLLAAWQYAGSSSDRPDYLLAQLDGRMEIMALGSQNPCAWYTADSAAKSLSQVLASDRLARSLPDSKREFARLGEIDWPLEESIRRADLVKRSTQTDQDPPSVYHLAAKSAQRLLRGQAAGWVNFRRDSLASRGALAASSRYLSAAAVLLVLLLAAASAGLWWKGQQLRHLARQARAAQTRDFAFAHPGQSVPPDIRAYLESQYQRLSGIRGADRKIPFRSNALATLGQVLAAMPANMRLRLVDIRIDDGDVYLEGQVRRHSDAQTLYQKLTDRGFLLQPPDTDNLASRGVSFRLTGSFPKRENLAGLLEVPALTAAEGSLP
jgi:hypothetical protein